MVWDPTNKYVYVSAHNSGQVTGKLYDANTGELSQLSRGSTFSATGLANAWPSAVRSTRSLPCLSPDHQSSDHPATAGTHTAPLSAPAQRKHMTSKKGSKLMYKRALQAAMAAGISVAIGLGATACSRDYVADYVYTVSASGPNINAFAVDYQSGILTQVTGSPFQTGFKRETTLVPSPDGKYIYVLSGFEDSAVEVFAVGTDGKLYGQKTYTLSGGTYPTPLRSTPPASSSTSPSPTSPASRQSHPARAASPSSPSIVMARSARPSPSTASRSSPSATTRSPSR